MLSVKGFKATLFFKENWSNCPHPAPLRPSPLSFRSPPSYNPSESRTKHWLHQLTGTMTEVSGSPTAGLATGRLLQFHSRFSGTMSSEVLQPIGCC